jgi:prevent-host-death family protein
VPQVGVRELKNQTTKILRDIRENQAKYIITYHGQPMALILPLEERWLKAKTEAVIEAALSEQVVWNELAALRQEIDQGWQSEKTAVDLIAEQRR